MQSVKGDVTASAPLSISRRITSNIVCPIIYDWKVVQCQRDSYTHGDGHQTSEVIDKIRRNW